MKLLVRGLLAAIFVSVVGLVIFLLHGPKEKETWATLTAALAVIAAVISIWPSLRILEIQEDATRPAPTPYFDMTSRYHLLQLRVKNIGAGVAYDIRLKWKAAHPQDEDGNDITAVDFIEVLMPDDSTSVLIGRTNEIIRKYPNLRLEGTIEFKDATGRRRCQLTCPR